VDCDYFDGRTRPPEPGRRPYVVAAGVESRDYTTLIEAVRGLDVGLEIAAASHWAGRKIDSFAPDLPPNVRFGSYSYAELRDLYAGAALAVVPLHASVYQHGITALQEAMAMGLPVIVTRTQGQGDVIIDRRRVLRAEPGLPTADGGFARLFAPDRPDLRRSNGFYVGVGDVDGLWRTIGFLLGDPEMARSVGTQGQLYARELLSLERFVERAVRLVTAAQAGKTVSQDLLR
jgi:glycosyltransferase involved in cell wall biosynthesis